MEALPKLANKSILHIENKTKYRTKSKPNPKKTKTNKLRPQEAFKRETENVQILQATAALAFPDALPEALPEGSAALLEVLPLPELLGGALACSESNGRMVKDQNPSATQTNSSDYCYHYPLFHEFLVFLICLAGLRSQKKKTLQTTWIARMNTKLAAEHQPFRFPLSAWLCPGTSHDPPLLTCSMQLA